MSCPFKHVWARSPDDPKEDPSSSNLSPSVPENGQTLPENNANINTTTTVEAEEATCPMGYGARPTSTTTDDPAATPPPPATCPLGFGSSSGPKLSALHCMICKSLLFDCVETNCSHHYCRECISRFQDCPTCGADITSLTAAPDAQSTVETFLATHAGDTSLWQMEGTTTPKIPSTTEPSSSVNPSEAVSGGADGGGRAAFFLQVGIRAMSGGNLPSAKHRLTQCKVELETQLAATTSSSSSLPLSSSAKTKIDDNGGSAASSGDDGVAIELLGQLGAVLGCIGDCSRADGKFDDARNYYEESLTRFQQSIDSFNSSSIGSSSGSVGTAAAEENPHTHAMSVTLNKIGELWHMEGNLEEAIGKYSEALRIREDRWQRMQQQHEKEKDDDAKEKKSEKISERERLEAAVDVVVSQLKVADAMLGLGRGTEAEAHTAAAKVAMEAGWVVRAAEGVVSEPLGTKIEAINEHLAHVYR